MFTGIVTDVGEVRRLERRGDLRAEIGTAWDTGGIALGASIACSGACLTVVDKGAGRFAVDVSGETLERTTLGAWAAGTRVNLERALRLGDELGGHIVSGHVDGVATLESMREEGGSRRLAIRVPRELARFLAPKGSVALDGISLTVNEVGDETFGVNIVPHTWENTTLGAARPGARMNLEVDTIARYVARLTQTSGNANDGGA